MSPMGLKSLFEELVVEIRRVSPNVVERLRPGLPERLVKERIAKVPFQLSSDAVALYSWADGANGGFEMLPGGYFIPLDQAMSEFDIFHQMRDEMQEIFFQPYRDCFRFLSDWSDGGYAFGRIDSPSKGQIINLSIHAPWNLAYRDLSALLKTSIECLRQGVMTPGAKIADFKAYYKVAARMNPGMENWTTKW
jgi:hypothetical protein